MYIDRYGDGREIFLGLHGWGNDQRIFRPLAQFVPHQAVFQSAALPGCSLSPAPAEWSVDSILGEILETITDLGDSPITLVGHCGGAIFGLLAAEKAGTLIKRIVLVDPFAYLPRYFKVFVNDFIGKYAYRTTFANPVGRWITNRTLQNTSVRGSADLTASFSGINHQTAVRYLTLFAEIEKTRTALNISAEVDLIYGEKSFKAVKKSIDLLKEMLPQARVWQVSGAAHLPFEEAAAEISQIIFQARQIDDSSVQAGILIGKRGLF